MQCAYIYPPDARGHFLIIPTSRLADEQLAVLIAYYRRRRRSQFHADELEAYRDERRIEAIVADWKARSLSVDQILAELWGDTSAAPRGYPCPMGGETMAGPAQMQGFARK
jgi:hypothetical protein